MRCYSRYRRLGQYFSLQGEGYCPKNINHYYADCPDEGRSLAKCTVFGSWGQWTATFPSSCDTYNQHCHSGLSKYMFMAIIRLNKFVSIQSPIFVCAKD